VAGASEGLGAAFCRALCVRDLNVLLIARRADALETLASELRGRWPSEVRCLCCDLGSPELPGALRGATGDLDIAMAVYNAAFSTVGPLLDTPVEQLLRVVDVNIRGPLQFVHALAPAMVARGRGGIVLMSSIAGLQGAPHLAAYAASKAFNIVLGESLWAELGPKGVEVVVSCAGAIRTPGYLRTARRQAPGTLDPAQVAEQTLRALGKGPRVVPGATNKLAALLLSRLLSRRQAIAMMGSSTTALQEPSP
jgi:hypothetical protein